MKIYKKILIFSFIFFVQFNLIACEIMEFDEVMESDEEEMVGRYTLTKFHENNEPHDLIFSESYLELTIDGDNHSGLLRTDTIHLFNIIKINDWFYESDKSVVSIKYEGYSEYVEYDVIKHAEIILWEEDFEGGDLMLWEK